MEDETLAILGVLPKAVGHAFQARVGRVQLGVHLEGGLFLEDALAVQLPVLQVGDHKTGHVGRCGAQRAHRVGQLKHETTLDILVGVVVACGHVRGQVLGQRLAEGAVCHAQRRENVLFHIIVERQAGDALDDLPRQGSAVIGVGGYFPRWENARRQVGFQPIAQRAHPPGLKPP